VVVLYSSPTQTVRSRAFRTEVTSVLARLPRSRVDSVATYWSTGSPQFVGASGRETYAVIELAGSNDGARQKSYDAIKWQLLSPWLQDPGGRGGSRLRGDQPRGHRRYRAGRGLLDAGAADRDGGDLREPGRRLACRWRSGASRSWARSPRCGC